MTDQQPVRIAMWSGPRTVSTAMMRAWENRPDAVVVDEPLYAYYLADVDLDALAGLRHAFLLRDPRRLLASYARVRSAPALADLGVTPARRGSPVRRCCGWPPTPASRSRSVTSRCRSCTRRERRS